MLSPVLLVLKCLSRVALDALKSSNFFIDCRKLHAQKNENYKALRNPFSSGPDGDKFTGALSKKKLKQKDTISDRSERIVKVSV